MFVFSENFSLVKYGLMWCMVKYDVYFMILIVIVGCVFKVKKVGKI